MESTSGRGESEKTVVSSRKFLNFPSGACPEAALVCPPAAVPSFKCTVLLLSTVLLLPLPHLTAFV